MSAKNILRPATEHPERLAGHQTLETLLFVGVLVSLFWSIYFAVVTISMPYQIELREGSALITTELLLNGENPYNFQNQPLGINVYGIGYSLAVLPFAYVFDNTIHIHRFVTLIFILSSACICFIVVYKTNRNISLALACGAFVTVGLIGHGGIGAFPSAMGAFLFLLAVLLPQIRSFDNASLVISILASLLVFYTKPYFILSFGIVATYIFLFLSKKRAILFGILFAFVMTLFFAAVRFMFPLYFINTIICNISTDPRSVKVLLNYLLILFWYFYPVVILCFLLVGSRIFSISSTKLGTGKVLDFSAWDRPLLARQMDYHAYALACSFLAFLFVLGPHAGGTGLNYAYQLLVPLFFCWLLLKSDTNGMIRFVIAPILLFNLFIWQYSVLHPDMLKQKGSREWAQLFEYIKPSSNIFNSTVMTSKVIAMGLTPVDAGQGIVFYEILPYPDFKLIGPSYESIYFDGVEYVKSVDYSIRKQKYDLVFITREKAVFFHFKHLSNYYMPVAIITVDMPQTNQRWTVHVWKPKGN